MKKSTGLIGSRPGPNAAEILRVCSQRTDGQRTDGQTDRRTDGRKEGRENMRGLIRGGGSERVHQLSVSTLLRSAIT